MKENITFTQACKLCKGQNLETGKTVVGYYVRLQEGDATSDYIVSCGESGRVPTADSRIIKVVPDSVCRHTGYQENGIDVQEKDQIKYHFGDNVGIIRFGTYANVCDGSHTEHDGFYVDWNGNGMLRKDLGYWINALYDEDNLISQNKISIS